MLRRARPRAAVLTILAGFLVNACAETELALHAVKTLNRSSDRGGSPAGTPSYKVGTPYQVDGVWYYPAEDLRYAATGVASWYGDAFHGRTTANGETFDKMALTAAHPTLPMPSQVRVTNLRNGKSLELRVNDRGPFVAGRVIDVSQRAAQVLGFEADGTTPVRVEIMPEASLQLKMLAMRTDPGMAVAAAPKAAPVAAVAVAELAPPPAPAPMVQLAALTSAGPAAVRPFALPAPPEPVAAQSAAAKPATTKPTRGVYVQTGAFLRRENALAMRDRLKTQVAGAAISPAGEGSRTWYRVRVGPLPSTAEAEAVKRKVAALGMADARLVVVTN